MAREVTKRELIQIKNKVTPQFTFNDYLDFTAMVLSDITPYYRFKGYKDLAGIADRYAYEIYQLLQYKGYYR